MVVLHGFAFESKWKIGGLNGEKEPSRESGASMQVCGFGED